MAALVPAIHVLFPTPRRRFAPLADADEKMISSPHHSQCVPTVPRPLASGTLSKIESDRNNFTPPRQYSFGRIAAIFLLVGPPTFVPLFYLAADLATRNGDTIHAKIGEASGMVLSPYGLLASYAVGFIPSLIAGLTYESGYRYRTFGRRLRLAALIGAGVNFLLWGLVVLAVFGGEYAPDWAFATYVTAGAAVAGAISAFLCALILETI